MIECARFTQNSHEPSFFICEVKQSSKFAGYKWTSQLGMKPCDTKSSQMNEEAYISCGVV